MMQHKSKMLNESLLDAVDVEDVKDDDSDDICNVMLVFDCKTSFEGDNDKQTIENYVNKVLLTSHFIERYKEPLACLLDLTGNKSCLIVISFYSENMSLGDFCILINRIAVLFSGYVIRLKFSNDKIKDKPGEFKFSTNFGRFEIKEHPSIEIIDEESFYWFFHIYFPDKSESEILKSFCRSCIRCNTRDNNINYRLCFDGTYNLVDYDGNLLLDGWFRDCYDFHDGFARVNVDVKDGNDKWNFIDKETGDLVSTTWYDEVCDFHEGFAVVKSKINGKDIKYNFINKDGLTISPVWFDGCRDFSNGLAVVHKYESFFINTKGELLKNNKGKKIHYTEVEDFSEGYAPVFNGSLEDDDYGWNYIDTNGNVLCPGRHFFKAYQFHDGFAVVEPSVVDANYIDTSGNFLLDNNCDKCFPFVNGYAVVMNNHKYNVIDKKGNLIFSKWINPEIKNYSDGFFRVYHGTDYNFIDVNGHYISDKWFHAAEDFKDGFAKVENYRHEINYINRKGNLAFPKFVDKNWIEQFGELLISKDGICVDSEGNIVSMI